MVCDNHKDLFSS